MKESTKKNFIALFIGGIVCPVIASSIYGFISKAPFWSGLLSVLIWIYNLMICILDVDLKLWWILSTFVLGMIIMKLWPNNERDKTKEHQLFTKYTQDRFNGVLWRWEWHKSNRGWRVVDLKPYCSKDDTPLYVSESIFNLEYKCPRCKQNYSFPLIMEENEVEILILDNVRKKGLDRS